MVRKEREHINRRWFWAFLISLLVHVILFLLMNDNLKAIFNILPERTPDVREIVFDLVPSQRPGEVIQTLSESAMPPQQADFLSDRHSIAMNDATAALQGSMPRFNGQTEFSRNFNLAQPERGVEFPSQDSRAEAAEKPVDGFRITDKTVSHSTSSFSREKLLGLSGANASETREPTYQNTKSSVAEQGGISFNTYAWEFAPYLIKLKERLQHNLFPPTSFTRLGFGGDNLLKFRIMPDGVLQGPSILRAGGDQALIETSRKAVTLSAPFWPLPEEFPEEYLEVTVHFQYLGLTPTK